MTKEEFQSFIHPTYLTFETFKSSLESQFNKSIPNINVDSVIFQEVLIISDNDASYSLSTNKCAVFLNYALNGTSALTTTTDLANNTIYLVNAYPGLICTKNISTSPTLIPSSFIFLIFRFN